MTEVTRLTVKSLTADGGTMIVVNGSSFDSRLTFGGMASSPAFIAKWSVTPSWGAWMTKDSSTPAAARLTVGSLVSSVAASKSPSSRIGDVE